MPPVFRCLFYFRFTFSWGDETCVDAAGGETGFNVGHEARAQKRARRLGAAGQFGRNAQRGHRTATQPTLYQRGCWSLRVRRRISNLSEANLPNTEAIANGRTTSGTQHRLQSRIEPHSIPRDVGNLPDRSRPRESASRHRCSLDWKSAPVRTLACLGLHPEDLFGETVAPQPRRRRKPKYCL